MKTYQYNTEYSKLPAFQTGYMGNIMVIFMVLASILSLIPEKNKITLQNQS